MKFHRSFILSLATLASALVALVASEPRARAAGLYFSDRGVRPVGRAGAFVAGADDLGALWYNPAGIAFAGNSFLADASWLHFGSTFQRRSVVTLPDGSEQVQGTNYFPEVSGTSPVLPLPTLAVSNNFGSKDWNFAFGVYAPYAALTSYPEQTVDFHGKQVPAPQRYSLITLDGSKLAIITANASYMPTPKVAIGAGLQVLAGSFVSKLAFSACPPDRLICASEQPDYDAVGQLSAGPIVAPSGNLGVIGVISEDETSEIRLGAMFQLPFWISAPAKVKMQLPSAPEFQNASIQGDEAHVRFKLPPIARFGIEGRFGQKKQTRIEGSFFYEAWSFHDSITISPAGSGIQMRNVTGFPDPYVVGTMSVQKHFRDTFSVHGGLEQDFELDGYGMVIRAGVSYERSAIPPSYLSVQTVDLDKVQLALGGSLYLVERALRLDIVIAHTFGIPVDVDPHDAQISRVHVVRANYPDGEVKINGGRYTAQADVLGVGLSWKY